MKTIEITYDESKNYLLREAFNTLRTNVLFCGTSVKTIVVTSCIAHEGKSTVTFDLARSLADAGKRVLVLDTDLRKSVLATRLTQERGFFGLSQLLSGQVTFEQALCHTQIPGLDIVFAGPFPPNPTELVGAATFRELLDSQRDNYDYIFVDAPPLGLVIDAAVIASACDGAIIVVNTGHVKYRLAQNVKSQLEKSGCRILGVVLNQVDKKRTKGGEYKSHYEYYEPQEKK